MAAIVRLISRANGCFAGLVKGSVHIAKPAAHKSIVPFDGKPRIFRRGGARKRAGKASEALSANQVNRLALAIEAAVLIGLPLNRFITIHWERAGVSETRAAWATVQFLKYARDRFAKLGLSFAYVWIRENDDGDGRKGDHVHILAHVPDGQSLGQLQRGWIRRITGRAYRQGVIRTGRVAGAANAVHATPEHYQANLVAVGEYVLKGGREATATALGLGRWGEGGRVIGRRCGMSRNLSRTVQKIKLG